MIAFSCYKFHSLTVDKLYAILALRSEVFVVEQNCVYQDIDYKDDDAIHFLGFENDILVAYLRLFSPTIENDFAVFGRVVTANIVRQKGYGGKIIQEILDYCKKHFPGITIKCSAQRYLKKFYEGFEFKVMGDPYDEDGIPHITMQKN